MLLYILKSSTILLAFFIFYKLFLEKENMHVFKRFYLIASLIAAFGIPFITFTSYVFVSPMEEFSQVSSNDSFIGILIEENKTDYLAITLWTIYGLGVLLFGLKFLKNITQLLVKIKRNDKVQDTFITKVLLVDFVIPHTFFKYIFLNKSDFENQQIPQEVLLHEETHALQKHSIDVLFIEFLQVVFWFNPFIYLIKHAIKLNHEFLADQAVLNQGIETSIYQKTLLHFSSDTNQPRLANAINYSFIKKRFTIMKTQTSQKAIWLRSLVLLPLLTVLIYGFSEKLTIEKLTPQIEETQINETKQDDIKQVKDYINKQRTQEQSIKITLEDINNLKINYLVKDVEIAINSKKEILINGENYATLENIAEEVNNIVSVYSPEQLNNVTASIQADGNLKMAFIIDVKEELRKTGIVRYKQTYTFQDKATPEQIAEYNKLVKKYNEMSMDSFIIKYKEVKRLKHIYSLMSATQKKKAEVFPNFPPPPPAPDAPSIKGTTGVPPPPSAPNRVYSAPRKVYKDQKSDNVPPPPPSPPNPLDHIIELAKKGAIFYNEDKEISSDKAIDIVKKNKSINIQVLDHNSSKPIVKLSKKPITIQKK